MTRDEFLRLLDAGKSEDDIALAFHLDDLPHDRTARHIAPGHGASMFALGFRLVSRPIRIAEVKGAVCAEFNLPAAAMTTRERPIAVARPRQIAMFLAYERGRNAAGVDISLPAIGRAFGNRDHTTALHACRKVRSLMATKPKFAARVIAVANAIDVQDRSLRAIANGM